MIQTGIRLGGNAVHVPRVCGLVANVHTRLSCSSAGRANAVAGLAYLLRGNDVIVSRTAFTRTNGEVLR